MREQSRISPAFIADQEAKRKTTEDGTNNENSVPALRDRVNRLEELLAVKSYVS